jgi:ribosomal protein L5
MTHIPEMVLTRWAMNVPNLKRVRVNVFAMEKLKVLYRAFMMLSVITNIYNKKTKGPTLM